MSIALQLGRGILIATKHQKMKYRQIGEEWGEGADERSIDALNIVEQEANSRSTP